jgi:hypothetical protein
MSAGDHNLAAARRLHDYISDHHVEDGELVGPDCGLRLTFRAGRFVKSYLPLPWRDSLYYAQGQAYWILACWRLLDNDAEADAAESALRCADRLMQHQRPDGAWDYPNPAWRGRIATAEGTWAAIALLECYRRTRTTRYLDAALKWNAFLDDKVGYQRADGMLAVNYFAGRRTDRVPNNAAFVLRFSAELNEFVDDPALDRRSSGLLAFLDAAQAGNGELPYSLPTNGSGDGKAHFQCFQYNAFECLDVLRYYELTRDDRARPVIDGLARFVAAGIERNGHTKYSCIDDWPHVTYHSTAIGAALRAATRDGFATADPLAERAYESALALQRPDGSFPYSRRDYGFLSDRRPYPRNLAMILFHLLEPERAAA